mmetsp:Transcript_12850/g.25120  ORF Transcript_12850/g.25120 Transcript_12850/m.25120 type:complete len:96 (+) Transcript_12850:145-432(+)
MSSEATGGKGRHRTPGVLWNSPKHRLTHTMTDRQTLIDRRNFRTRFQVDVREKRRRKEGRKEGKLLLMYAAFSSLNERMHACCLGPSLPFLCASD